MNPVGSRRKPLQSNAHDTPADLSLSLINSTAIAVADLDRTEGRFEILREPKRKLTWCDPHRAANARLGTIELSVRLGRHRSEEDREQNYDDEFAMHGQWPSDGLPELAVVLKSGLPIEVGKRSSR